MRQAVKMVWGPCPDCNGACRGQKGSDGTTHVWIYQETVGAERIGLFSGHNANGLIERFPDIEGSPDIAGARDRAQSLAEAYAEERDAAIPREGEPE